MSGRLIALAAVAALAGPAAAAPHLGDGELAPPTAATARGPRRSVALAEPGHEEAATAVLYQGPPAASRRASPLLLIVAGTGLLVAALLLACRRPARLSPPATSKDRADE